MDNPTMVVLDIVVAFTPHRGPICGAIASFL